VVPLVGCPPLHPPDAVQVVAFVELQLSVEVPPVSTLVGFAVNVTVGAGTTVTVTAWLPVPPVPVQVNVKLVVAANAAVGVEPFVG
jgi:hypothetical protein